MLRVRPPAGQVPLYGADGVLQAWVAADWVEAHCDHLRVVRTRRAHRVVRAYLRSDSDLTEWLEATMRRSNFGNAFVQHFESGAACWALRGVRGSR
ncbi:MAG: hypothetical protein WHT08_18245 [Bryobacteraceae bacterium]